MTEPSLFMREASRYDTTTLLADWAWLVPPDDKPLFISALGDWVFAKPDRSLWVVSLLDGDYFCAARDPEEYNVLNKSSDWLDEVFLTGWFEIATANGLIPSINECIGWKVHPKFGAKIEASNLQVFDMRVYQRIMGQLHRQFQGLAEVP